MNDDAEIRLDPESVLILAPGDLELARILAEETDRERRLRQAVAFAAPQQSEHTLEDLNSMSWDEFLILDGECFIRCCARSELPAETILQFAEAQCEPANRLAVRYFRLFVRALSDKEGDAAAVIAKVRSESAKAAAEAKHEREGGSRWKRQRIREIWASGKYSSRDICAEQEAAELGMSFSTARKALRGTPDPG